jgi:hypothetical protein
LSVTLGCDRSCMTEMDWFIKREADADDALDETASVRRFLSTLYDSVLEVSDESGALSSKSRMLMTLLTYCYARGLYSASAIASATRENPVARYVCAGDYPTAEEIREFRRNRKILVVKALAKVLERFCALRPCQLSAIQESERRVAKAIQWDSFELDL